MNPNADTDVRRLDQNEIRTQQILAPLLLTTAYVVDNWRLVAAQCVVFLLTVIRYDIGPYVLLYRRVLRPLGFIKPDVRVDNPEAHRFATGFGFIVAAGATYLLAVGATLAGWIAVSVLATLAVVGFFGWCAGCFTYYLLNRFGAGGFFRRPPIEGSAFPGLRPPKG